MLNILPYLFVVAFGSEISWPPLTQINADSLFGIQKIATQDSMLEQYIVDRVKGIRLNEDHSTFMGFCKVNNRYYFKELPGLKLYRLLSGELPHPGQVKPYNYVLFNSQDSSVYHFGGDIKSFSRVVKPALPTIIREGKVLELIKMYLYTLSNADHFYIIDSIAVYKALWQDQLNYLKDAPFKPIEYSSDNVEKDINKVKYNLKPTSIKRINDSVVVQLYSWEWEYGNLEYWEFQISPLSIQLLKRKIIIPSIGPKSMGPRM